MFSLLLKNFLRSRIAVTGLAVVMLAGILSIYIGRQHLQKQQQRIARTDHFQQEHIQRNVLFFDKEMGLLLYYLRFGLANETSPYNALSIGQRDVNTSVQSITIRGLENQRYDTDLFNPANLLAGNLDFSFVLIFLFPLLIIAFTYNILSEEKEGGTWKLVAVQSARPFSVVLQKFAVRAIVVFAALAILMLLAAIVLQLPLDSSLLATSSIAVLYLLCWFTICGWVVSLQKKSSLNAAGLLSGWILLTIVIPGAVNNYLLNKYPVPEALATAVQQREGYHEKWDMEKSVTMEKFYAHYPQFHQYRLPDAEFSWLWYYAMQQMGDDDAQAQTKQMHEKLWQRERATERISWFIPTLHAQHQLNTIARSGLGNHLQFLDSTAKFHEKKRLYFYPRIFENSPVAQENWQQFGMEYFSEDRTINWVAMLTPFLVITGLLAGVAFLNFRNKLH